MLPEIVPLTLAREELVYIMRALTLESLPSLAPPLLAPMSPEAEAVAMAVVDRTLQARELVVWQSVSERVLAAGVVGIIQRFAQPRACVRLELHQRDLSPFVILFVVAEQGIIGHWPTEPGVHHFLAFPDWASLSVYLRAIMSFDATIQGPQEQVRVAGDLVNKVLRATPDDARNLLAPHMAVPLALALAATLTQPVQRADIAAFPGDPANHVAQKAFTLFAGKGGVWQMRPLDEEGTWLEARGITAEGAYALLRPLFTVSAPVS